MKNKLLLLLSVVLVVTVIALCGCSNIISVDRLQHQEDAEFVQLTEKNIELIVGQKHTLVVNRYVKDCDTVTFTSSNNNVVLVDSDGVITPIAKGSVQVTATCGNYSDSCTVNVILNHMNGSIDVKQVTNNKLSLANGNNLPLETKVVFNSMRYDFVPTYTVEDNTVCSIQDGTLCAKKVGSTTVTVNGSWSDQQLEEYSFVVEVKNVPEFVVTDKNSQKVLNEIDLYTTSSFAGNSYNTEVGFDITAQLNGNPVNKNDISFEVINNDRNVILDSVNKIIRYRSNSGRCELKMSFEANGETYSKSIIINVKQPVKDYPTKVLVDVSKGIINAEDIFEIGNTTIIEIASDDDITLQDGKLFGFTVDNEKSQQVTVYNGLVGYNLEIVPYTRIFTTAEELAYFRLSQFGQTFSGYYILGNDIDASSYVHANNVRYAGDSYNKYPNDGLVGVFDGKGHTIDGMTVGRSGFFGAIGVGGVVKNVAFTNLKFTEIEDAVGLACYINRATLRNVYVQADNLEGKNRQGYRTGLVAYHVDVACDVQNCIFELDTKYTPSVSTAKNWFYGAYTGYCSQLDKLNSASPDYLKNCYVISPSVMTHMSGSAYVDCKAFNFVDETLLAYTYPNVKHYDNYVEMSQVATNDYSSFDTEYWDLSNGYPQWKTANY